MAFWLVLASFFNFASAAGNVEIAADGLTFKIVDNSRATLTGFNAELPSAVVVPAYLKYDGGSFPVRVWNDEALNRPADSEVSADHLITINCEDGPAGESLYIFSQAINGWSALKTIEFPSHLTEVDADCIINCPALESVTLRSDAVIKVNYAETEEVIGTAPVLYVKDDLVDAYKDAQDMLLKDFVARFSAVLPIVEEADEPDPAAGVHIVMGDLHLKSTDLKAGDKITLEAPENNTFTELTVNKVPQTIADDSKLSVTIPDDYDGTKPLVLAATLSRPLMSSVPGVAVQSPGAVRATSDGFAIAGYDGSLVVVIDMGGRVMARTHRPRVNLPKGLYIVMYAGNGTKICVK